MWIFRHPTTFNGAFVPSLAVHMFEVEFFGKAAHAVITLTALVNPLIVGSCPVGGNQCPRCHDSVVRQH
jgi:hypothetical protein